jgi:hypothetical protein
MERVMKRNAAAKMVVTDCSSLAVNIKISPAGCQGDLLVESDREVRPYLVPDTRRAGRG